MQYFNVMSDKLDLNIQQYNKEFDSLIHKDLKQLLYDNIHARWKSFEFGNHEDVTKMLMLWSEWFVFGEH